MNANSFSQVTAVAAIAEAIGVAKAKVYELLPKLPLADATRKSFRPAVASHASAIRGLELDFVAIWRSGRSLESLFSEDPKGSRAVLVTLARSGLLSRNVGKVWDEIQLAQLRVLAVNGADIAQISVILGRYPWSIIKKLCKLKLCKRETAQAYLNMQCLSLGGDPT